MGEQRSIKIHYKQLDRRRTHLLNLAAATDLRDACASGEIPANTATPPEAESGNECGHRVGLTVAKFKCRRAAWAKEAREFGNKAANTLKAVASAIERDAWFSGDRHLRETQWCGPLISLSSTLEARGVSCRIHLCARHVREVGDKEVKMRRIAWGTAGEEWLREVAVQERDSRGDPRAKCI